MFESTRQIISSKDGLLEAIDEQSQGMVVSTILERDFTILGYPKDEGLDPETTSEAEYDEHLQWEADQLADDMADKEDLEAMTVECNGRTALVAFTKEEYVDSYIEQLTHQWNRLVGVPAFDISGETLLEMITEDCDILLNPGSEEERLIEQSLLTGRG